MSGAWHSVTAAPAGRRFWALHEGRCEVWPAILGETSGPGPNRLSNDPELRFLRHPTTGQGFFAKWWCEIELPGERGVST